MASPQVENGHTKIANEIMERLFSRDLSGAEFRVAACIIRHCYGWRRKECELSVSKISQWTGLTERSVSRTASDLERKKIISVSRGSGRGNLTKWSFNKDWESWEKDDQTVTLKKDDQPVMDDQNGNNGCPLSHPLDTKPVTLFDCKSTETKGPQSPKAIFKENKETYMLFEVFYRAYPRHVARADAEKAWRAIGPDKELLDVMLSALNWQRETEDWRKDNGHFVPYPATWLRAKRWLDEKPTNGREPPKPTMRSEIRTDPDGVKRSYLVPIEATT